MGRSVGAGRGWRWALVAAIALAFALSTNNLRAAPSAVVVPRLSGGPAAAYARLHAAGLLVNVPAWTSGAGTSPVVTRTVPRAGAPVGAGSAVTLYLSYVPRPVSHLLRRVSSPPIPNLVGHRVSAASRWAALHHVPFLAHLAALRRADAPWLLADYVITAQLPSRNSEHVARLTVWGRQRAPKAPARPAPPLPPPPTATTATAATTTTTTTTTTAPPPPPPPVTYYQNSVYSDAAFPDPFVLDNNNSHSDYWAFGTGSLFPTLHSSDLVHWTSEGRAMTARPSWVVTSGDWHPWAPSVIQTSQQCPGASTAGCYVMYYVGLSQAFNRNCIAVATSPTPGGPYTDQGPLALTGQPNDGSTMPVGCGDSAGVGNIDPSPFIDPSGQAYLYLSTDNSCTNGSSCTLKPSISEIPLTPDLLQAANPRVPLFSGDSGTWEAAGAPAPTVEGPSMELHNGTYYLFYSGGSYIHAYGMGYASGPSPAGPFTKSPDNPILAPTSTVFSPGGADQFVTGPHGGLWLAYHARASSSSNPRTLWIDPVRWEPAAGAGAPDVPEIAGPTSTPQSIQP